MKGQGCSSSRLGCKFRIVVSLRVFCKEMSGVQSGKFVRGHWGLECYAHASLTNTVYTYKNLKQSIQPQVAETGRITR